jgi:hypothetical protein
VGTWESGGCVVVGVWGARVSPHSHRIVKTGMPSLITVDLSHARLDRITNHLFSPLALLAFPCTHEPKTSLRQACPRVPHPCPWIHWSEWVDQVEHQVGTHGAQNHRSTVTSTSQLPVMFAVLLEVENTNNHSEYSYFDGLDTSIHCKSNTLNYIWRCQLETMEEC